MQSWLSALIVVSNGAPRPAIIGWPAPTVMTLGNQGVSINAKGSKTMAATNDHEILQKLREHIKERAGHWEALLKQYGILEPWGLFEDVVEDFKELVRISEGE